MKHNAWIEKGYFDERPFERVQDAEIEIGPRDISVAWREGDNQVRLEGARNGQGHFLLRSADGSSDATLHRFQHSAILEGFWKRHDGATGFWRVHLPAAAIADQIELPKPPRATITARKPARKPARRRAKAAA